MEIAVPYVQIEAINPNINDDNVTNPSTIYFKCILVCFTTIRRIEPNIKLVLYTNSSPPIDFVKNLDKLAVEIRLIEYNFCPPHEFGERFRGCFFIFDAIMKSKTSTLFLDPDVIAVGSILEIEQICGNHIGVFELDFPKNQIINGITFGNAHNIFTKFEKETDLPKNKYPACHLGGEILYIPESKLIEISKNIRDFWTWNIASAKQGLEFLPTEEHILTHVLKHSESVLLNSYISRIWTTKKFTKHEGNSQSVKNLKLWHLPAEKTKGFMKMYDYFSVSDFQINIEEKAFISKAKKQMNIDKPVNLISAFLYGLTLKILNITKM